MDVRNRQERNALHAVIPGIMKELGISKSEVKNKNEQ